MRNALDRCARDLGIHLDALTVRTLTSLLEEFCTRYRAQHVHHEDDTTAFTWTRAPDASTLAIAATRTVRRHDDGRAERLRIVVEVGLSPARDALGDGLLEADPGSFRRTAVYRLTADAAVHGRVIDAGARPTT